MRRVGVAVKQRHRDRPATRRDQALDRLAYGGGAHPPDEIGGDLVADINTGEGGVGGVFSQPLREMDARGGEDGGLGEEILVMVPPQPREHHQARAVRFIE